MIDENRINAQYLESEEAFTKIKNELHGTLIRMANVFYQQTRFQARVLEPRMKSVGSIIGKLKRKNTDADSLFLRRDDQLSVIVNDFLGARIVCNTREDVEEIVRLIGEISRFKIIKTEDFNKKPKASGYRAVHLDVLYHTYLNDDHIYIPVEIQIKTHLQNAWADITHDESYKPENENFSNQWEQEYSKHMADMLDTLDNMASTIRKQRLAIVRPPNEIEDSDTLINSKTLSYKLNKISTGTRLTQQEMMLVINRLKEEGYESLAEIGELLQDSVIEKCIKAYKESLRNDENVRPFELLYYGSLLKRNKNSKFEEEMRKDYGFAPYHCKECNRWLTEDELNFMKTKTDADTDLFCSDHWEQHFGKRCSRCGLITSNELCKNCEAETNPL